MPERGLAAVILAAGAGTRLRPLTLHRPKALCPVGNVPLVDLAIERARAHTPDVAVNVHAGRAQLEEHLSGRVHLSIEEPRALGTAGALVALRSWIAARPVLLQNADAWRTGGLDALLEGWDGTRVRLLVVEDRARADLRGRWRYTGAALLPARVVDALPSDAVGLYDTCFAPAEAEGRLELVVARGEFVDCGTPAEYHRANMLACAGELLVADGAVVTGDAVASVVGEEAVVAGRVERCVLWPSAVVREGESLRDAIRTPDLTIAVG